MQQGFNLNSSLNIDSSSEDPDDDENNDIAVVENELPLPAIFGDTDFNPDSDQHTENEENNMLLANIKTSSEDPDDDENNDIAVVENELPLPAIFGDTDFNPDSDQHTENEENNMLLANIKVT
ncbi:hypothetical protein FQR65_LT01070 [Abscondita terminalis]|nr:hypothetical protein FQR65_LT01070 [Abscondita terminalis]